MSKSKSILLNSLTGKDKFSDYRREDCELMNAGPPLDFSFRNATSMEELVKQKAQTTRLKKLPDKTPNRRYMTSSLWLNNNSFVSSSKLGDVAENFLESPIDLRWLDLSYNKLRDIDDDIVKFENLTILYLHGNDIDDIKCLLKLRKLCYLRSLTLHGNPIEKMPDYRRYVIAILPQIWNLDFSPVIYTEKKRALPTGFFKMFPDDAIN